MSKSQAELTGLISHIQRFSIHDGPGIRTTVFFQGCPLRCCWCHNPELISTSPQLLFTLERCVRCGRCVAVCPNTAQELSPAGERRIDRALCRVCGACVSQCCSGALVLSSKRMSVAGVMAEVERDRIFYETSNGGVTLSGGEPLLQAEFIQELLRQCKTQKLHTALETCGLARWDVFQKILSFVDLVLYDLKLINPGKHEEYTGVSNEVILDNLKKVIGTAVPIRVRVPIVPGHNDTEQDCVEISRFMKLAGLRELQLLWYHKLGDSKFRRMGRDNTLKGVEPHKENEQGRIREWFRANGMILKDE